MLTLCVLLGATGASYQAQAVDLGSTAHFAILSGAAITTTGGGIINGDVGASPIAGSAIGIPAAQVNGTIHEVDASGPAGAVIAPALLTAAKNDLTTACNAAAGRVHFGCALTLFCLDAKAKVVAYREICAGPYGHNTLYTKC